MTGPLTVVKESIAFGPITWEYVGTVDALDTQKVHPIRFFESFYYGVPRVQTPGFGTTTWDVWVPRKKRGKPGYTDAKIAKWQAACVHRFHDDALTVMEEWEKTVANKPKPKGLPDGRL